MRAEMQIVLAWAEQTKLVPTGRQVMRDMNWFPELRTELEGKAVMWMQKATEADMSKARAYAEEEGLLLLTFPPSEKHPLGKARTVAVEKNHYRKDASAQLRDIETDGSTT